MSKTKKSKKYSNRDISNAAKQALHHAQEIAKQNENWVVLHNAMFGIGGMVSQLFATSSERTAFSKTDEFQEVWRLIETLQGEGESYLGRLSPANGNISLRMPRSLHAALLKEAEVEGVSLNQLCVGKLAVQLRSAV